MFLSPTARTHTSVLDRVSAQLTQRHQAPAVRVVQVLLGIAVLAALAQLRIQIGPVPITGQTFGVLLIGAVFGRNMAGLTLSGYVLAGVLGAPIFTGGGSGLAAIAGPTGGYLIGFIIAAWLLGHAAERGVFASRVQSYAAMLSAHAVIYLCGAVWLMSALQVGPLAAVAIGIAPFIVGDVLKVLLAGEVLTRATK